MPSVINATTANGVTVQGDNSGSLQLATNNGTTAVTIDTSQNVGIGTASPGGYKLAVGDGSGNRGRIMLKGATGGNYPEINIDDTMNTSGKNYQIFSTGGHLKFQNQTDGALVSFVANAFGIGLADNAPVDGDGIRFPATQNASSNANTLDDYEEGTWTPTYNGFTSSGTVTVSGSYTKIGRMVRISGSMYASVSLSGGPGGVTYFSNLPFAPASGNTGYATASYCDLSTQTPLQNNAFAYGNVYPPSFSFNSSQTLFFTAVYQTD